METIQLSASYPRTVKALSQFTLMCYINVGWFLDLPLAHAKDIDLFKKKCVT